MRSWPWASAPVALAAIALLGSTGALAQSEASLAEGVAALRAGEGAAALSAFEAAADRNSAEAANLAGEMLQSGLGGVAVDKGRACDFFELAARADWAAGAHNLATCHFTGQGRPQDFTRAAQWYGAAIGGGFTKAQCALGAMYMQGLGVSADPVQGAALCRTAAEAGDADAQADLGRFYALGFGVDQDVSEAVIWLERAAAQGQPHAAFLLADLIWSGRIDGRERAASIPHWRTAVLAGRTDAARRLGDALLLDVMHGAVDLRDLDLERLHAARAAYDIAAAGDPDPTVRRHAVAQRAVIDEAIAAMTAP